MATILKHIEQTSYVQDLIDRVAPEWRIEFQQFVETGEAQEAFLNYLNQDTSAQDAVEQAFNRQAKRFEHLAEELKKQGPKISESAVSTPGASTSRKLAAVMEIAIHTPKEQRKEVVDTSTAELAASTPAEERKVLKEVARSLEKQLCKS